MNILKTSCQDLIKGNQFLFSKNIIYNPICNFGVLKKPKKIKGEILPQPHLKVNLKNDINQPGYLKYLKPTVPFYGNQTIKLKGYDFVHLNKYQKSIIKVLKKLDIKIKNVWKTPSQEISLDSYLKESYGIENSVIIHVYERNIHIDELPTYKAQILIDIIQSFKPPGVTLEINKYNSKDLEKLYMIDCELEKAKAELVEWDKPLEEIILKRKI